MSGTWQLFFVWDDATTNSLATFELTGAEGAGAGYVTVSLDLGSAFFSVATNGIYPVSDGYSPIYPLPNGTSVPFVVVPDSTVNASYGSGGFTASMATALINVNGALINITLGAMERYYPSFPLGGYLNNIGIWGLTYPPPPPYCVNGASVVETSSGKGCFPSNDTVTSVPLLQQLNSSGAINRCSVKMVFEGNTRDMNRYGTLTLGANPKVNGKSVPLEPIYGLSYQHSYYIIRVPKMYVGDYQLPMSERTLQGNTLLEMYGESYWFGGWIVDSGWMYTTLPQDVYNSTTAQMWEQYVLADGTMTFSSWENLTNIGQVSGTDCLVGADYCAPLESIPCVPLSSTMLRGLPTLTMQLSNGSTWEYPPENYMYPITSGCYQLGLTVNGQSIIGNLQMQGHSIFLDQETNIAQIKRISGGSSSSNSTLSAGAIGGICAAIIVFVGGSALLAYWARSKRPALGKQEDSPPL